MAGLFFKLWIYLDQSEDVNKRQKLSLALELWIVVQSTENLSFCRHGEVFW